MEYRNELNKRYHKKILEKQKTLPEFVNTYIAASMTALETSTLYQYVTDLSVFFDFIGKDISFDEFKTLSHTKIDEFVSYYKMGRSDKTLSRMLASISALYAYYIKIQRISYNPVSAIRKPKHAKKEINRLKGNEKNELLNTVATGYGLSKHELRFHTKLKDRDLAICTLFLSTGIRVSELVGLNINDIDFDLHGIVVTRKGGSSDFVYFSDEAESYLKNYISVRKPNVGEDALFLSRNGNRLDVRSVERLIKKYCATALPSHKGLSPHKLRSTFGTDFYEASGGDLLLTQKRMGHKNIATTTLYAEATKQRESESRNLV